MLKTPNIYLAKISAHTVYELNEQGQISVEENWNYICDNLSKAIDTFIPVKFCSNRTDAPWMTSQKIRKKCFYNKAKRSLQTPDGIAATPLKKAEALITEHGVFSLYSQIDPVGLTTFQPES